MAVELNESAQQATEAASSPASDNGNKPTTFSKVDVSKILKEIEEEEKTEKESAPQQPLDGMPPGFDPESMDPMAQLGLNNLPGMDLPGARGGPLQKESPMDPESLPQEVGVDIDVSNGKGNVIKRITKLGEGTRFPVRGDEVAMTYIGRIPTTDVEFDRNTDESNPFTFPLGMGRVIKGWDLAVATMKKGEEAVLTIQPEYGYGKSGAGEKIPPNSVLEFTVKLVNWRNENALDKEGLVMLTKMRENNDHWATPRDGWEVVVRYSARFASAAEPFEKVDSLLFAMPKDGPTDDKSLPPFFQVAAKKLKKTEIGEFIVPKEYFKGKGYKDIPEDADDDIVYEMEMLKWHEFDKFEQGQIVKKLVDEGSDWAKPKDNYKCKVVVKGYSRPSNTQFLNLGTQDEPHELVLGDASIPESLEVVIENMKKLEYCEATAPVSYGYGSPEKNKERGIPESDTELFYEARLLDFEKTKESWDMNYDEKLEDAARLKEQGSNLLRQGCQRQAVKKFELALRYFAYDDKSVDEEKKKEANKIRLPCLLNMAMIEGKAGNWYQVYEHAKKAVEIDPNSVKALYRRAQGCYYYLKEYAAAQGDLKKALELDTNKTFTAELNSLLKVATEMRKREMEKEKKLYQGIFSKMGAKKGKEEKKDEAKPMEVDGAETKAEPAEAKTEA